MEKKEICKHSEGLKANLENLITALYSDQELNLIYKEKDHALENLSRKKAWVKVSDLTLPDVTDKQKVLVHLLWLQSIRRVIIYDADPVSQAVLISLHFDKPQQLKQVS